VADCRLSTHRLELRPLPASAAAALPEDRKRASRLLGAALPGDWPLPDLLDVLPIQASAPPDVERFGVWVIIERESATVVGDIGFFGPPDASGVLEVGYSVVPDRRRRGYATEAAIALVTWALDQPGIHAIVATCDEDNSASILTLDRIGFRRTGEEDGRILWQCTADPLGQ
jgi:ribosomal-protein-alanine N-acetyltransferase